MHNLNKLVLDEAVKSLKDDLSVDSEALNYFPERYKFSIEDFNELFRALDEISGERKVNRRTKYSFPESKAYFEYNGYKLVWQVVIGQGSMCRILTGTTKEFNKIEKSLIVSL